MITYSDLYDLTALGISKQEIENNFPKDVYVLIWYDNDFVVKIVDKIAHINSDFIVNGILNNKGSKHKILKYPYTTHDAGFFIYLEHIAVKFGSGSYEEKIDKCEKIFYTWLNKEIAQEEADERWGGETYNIHFGANPNAIKEFSLKFFTRPSHRGAASNLLYLLDSNTSSLGVKLFGQVISKAYRAIYIEGYGILPEYTDGKMKYLLGGINASLNAKDSYDEAVKMLREGKKESIIQNRTGWVFSTKDGKPRFIIPNSDAKFREDAVFKKASRGAYLLTPKNMSIDEIEDYVGNDFDQSPVVNSFPKLGEILDFPSLFKHYPEFYNIRTCVALAPNSNESRFKPEPFYTLTSFSNPGETEAALSTLLHEIQHAIQYTEGFTEGGNLGLAKVVMAGGTDFWRTYKGLQNKFVSVLKERAKRANAKEDFYEKIYEADADVKEMIDDLIPTHRSEKIEDISSSIAMVLLNLSIKSALKDFDFNILLKCVDNYLFDEEDAPPFYSKYVDSLLECAIKYVDIQNELKRKGYAGEPIDALNYSYYLAFGGEIESRYVQQAYANLPFNLQKHFKILSAENTIDSIYIYDKPFEEIKAQFAYESHPEKGGILHLQPTDNPYSIIHEIGHAIYDLMIQIDPLNQVKYLNAFNLQSDLIKAKGYDEFCADSFCAYLKRNKIEPVISETFAVDSDLGVELQDMYKSLLNFDPAKKVRSERIKLYMDYLKKLNEHGE